MQNQIPKNWQKDLGFIDHGLYKPVFPQEWEENNLYSLAKWINGRAFKNSDFDTSGLPILKIAEIKNGVSPQTNFTKKDYSEEIFIKKGDILFPWSGTPETSIDILVWNGLNGWLNQHTFKVIPNPNISRAFFYYLLRYLKTNFIKIASNKQTTGLGHVTANDLKNLEVRIPEKPLQVKIASILSALDDKIILNNKIAKNLEEMAKAIFKEWFVHLNFPDRGAGMIDTNTYYGMIPEGWEILPLEDVCIKITDGSHFSPETVLSGKPMASVKDMNDWGINLESCRKISEEDYKLLVRNDCKPYLNDILIAKDGSYLKHIFMVDDEKNMVILSSIAMLRPNGRFLPNQLALFLKMPQVMAQMKGYVSGVAVPRIVLRDFRKFPVVVPPILLQQKWADLCDPMLSTCRKLFRENEELQTIRDLLLPKLMMGEIRV